MSKVMIVYFSGTGGTELIVNNIKNSLVDAGSEVETFPLDLSKVKSLSDANDTIANADKLIIAYPVYAFDAPSPIYRWIKTLPNQNGTKTAVLSISAGGDVSANISSRKRCKKKLAKKGLDVFYERMITMPSNYAITAQEEVNILLVKAAPIIGKKVAEDIANDVTKINTKQSSFMAELTAGLFSVFAPWFGKTLRANKKCNNCGLCQRVCPTNNLQINDGRLKKAYRCAYCMRCVYACPQNAIVSSIFSFSVISEGFDIKNLKREADKIENVYLEKIKKRKNWEGAYEYLNEVFKQ